MVIIAGIDIAGLSPEFAIWCGLSEEDSRYNERPMSSRYQVTPMQYALETADSNTCFLQELRGEQDLRPQPWWLPFPFWRVSPG
jgi:hypothetical protein